eukprot:scaffold3765_cov122-Isochrysis_galbana.AAC.1
MSGVVLDDQLRLLRSNNSPSPIPPRPRVRAGSCSPDARKHPKHPPLHAPPAVAPALRLFVRGRRAPDISCASL